MSATKFTSSTFQSFVYVELRLINTDVTGLPILPIDLKPLAILYFGDELRSDAKQTLERFFDAGIEIKIISGDNPDTVVALAKQAGIARNNPDETISAISGQDLAMMNNAQFIETAENTTIFGRITPEQKAKLVKSLQQRNHYVAMMGDGVNDALSLKQANVGIAMQSGSQITRNVADIVLLKDSFAALPNVFLEGQKIRNGIEDVTKLFLVRQLTFSLLILTTVMMGRVFPLIIKHNTLVTLLSIGLPAFAVTLWAKPSPSKHSKSLIRAIMHFVIPATLSLAVLFLCVYFGYLVVNVSPILDLIDGDMTVEQAQSLITSSKLTDAIAISRSALVTIIVLCGLLLMPFLKPPSLVWVGGEPYSGDWRYTFVALGLLIVYIIIILVAPLREFFELRLLSPVNYLILGLIALVWCLLIRYSWRKRVLDNFLSVDLGGS